MRAATARHLLSGAASPLRDKEPGVKNSTFLQRLTIRKDRLRFPQEKPSGAKWALLNALACLALVV